ncbi:HNH endonuclease [Psychromonas aquimarina]|uniref:HNH endonuclease n=1 Tax=Psychromonas aquimarina TaxID=444919 RepID=UPI0004237225|nr:HNH endonuclease [Psychromonas aquimarina]
MTVQFYLDKFQSLRTDRSNGHAKPHKVCLMFAVIDLIEQGGITQNRIQFNEQLKAAFTSYFEQLKQGNDQDTPHLPFYHLQSSQFWHLDIKPDHQKEFEQSKSASSAFIQRCVNFAYLDDELFTYLKSPITRSSLKEALTHNLGDLEIQYRRWALSIGKSDKTVKNYIGALKGSIPNWLEDAGIPTANLMTISSHSVYSMVAAKVMLVEEFKVKNAKGKGMYSAALKSYQVFLDDLTQASLNNDIEEILKDGDTTATYKAVLVNTRLGQGKFRTDLIDHWQGCALTGYSNTDFLIASHIKPWSKSNDIERLDPNNGFLLLANIDKAFDRGYITFTDKGKIRISECLDDYKALGLSENMGIILKKEHQDYLAYHREITFKN